MRCILVIGIDRSGTSCVAGILYHLGINMGEKLYGPMKTNPKGHFEDQSFRSTHVKHEQWVKKRVKEAQGLKIWGLKHPKLSRCGEKMVRLLKEQKVDVRVITTERGLGSVSRSMQARNPNMKRNWKDNALRAFNRWKDTVSRLTVPIMKVRYDDLIDYPGMKVKDIVDFCFEGLTQPTKKQIKAAIDFVDPKLRHWR